MLKMPIYDIKPKYINCAYILEIMLLINAKKFINASHMSD